MRMSVIGVRDYERDHIGCSSIALRRIDTGQRQTLCRCNIVSLSAAKSLMLRAVSGVDSLIEAYELIQIRVREVVVKIACSFYQKCRLRCVHLEQRNPVSSQYRHLSERTSLSHVTSDFPQLMLLSIKQENTARLYKHRSHNEW